MAIYTGDRWVPSNLMRSTYVWLPLTISGTTVSMSNHVNWTPNVAQGTWAPGPGETAPEAEAGVLAGGARSVTCTSKWLPVFSDPPVDTRPPPRPPVAAPRSCLLGQGDPPKTLLLGTLLTPSAV